MELKLKFEGYQGTITMRVANNIQRLEIMDDLSIDIMALASVTSSEEVKAVAAEKFMTLKNIIRLLNTSKEYFVDVSLKNGKKEYKSFDDLNNDPDCQSILMDCATKALLGIGGKEEKK